MSVGWARFPLPKDADKDAFVRWVAISVAAGSTLSMAIATARLLTGVGPFASPAHFAVLTFAPVALLFWFLAAVPLRPNPLSVLVGATGIVWEERSGRQRSFDWDVVSRTIHLGLAEYPFGNRSSSKPTSDYWLTYRRVRMLVITREAFEAIRAHARERGFQETVSSSATSTPAVQLRRIRFMS